MVDPDTGEANDTSRSASTASPGSTETDRLIEIGLAAGLTAVGVTGIEPLEPARSVLPVRKAAGLAGSMQFTYRNPERSADPTRFLPSARSLIAGALYYGPGHDRAHATPDLAVDPTVDAAADDPAADDPTSARIARYAWRDHYADLADALTPIAEALEADGYRSRIVADTNALVDRNVAWRAGLGWYGKNSNLLIPGAGSWFVLGAVVTEAPLAPTGPPLGDGCGACTQCIEDCPTDAIVAPGVIDATRCLAWIVQAPDPIPVEYRTAVGDRIYGCDDCQDVCPPNRLRGRAATATTDQAVTADPAATDDSAATGDEVATVEIGWLLTADDEEILARHGRWYIPRRDVDHVRRTALVVLGNIADPARPLPTDLADRSLDGASTTVEALLVRYLAHDSPVLRAHAVWAARRLGLDRLATGLKADPDEQVGAEFVDPVQPRFDGHGRPVEG